MKKEVIEQKKEEEKGKKAEFKSTIAEGEKKEKSQSTFPIDKIKHFDRATKRSLEKKNSVEEIESVEQDEINKTPKSSGKKQNQKPGSKTTTTSTSEQFKTYQKLPKKSHESSKSSPLLNTTTITTSVQQSTTPKPSSPGMFSRKSSLGSKTTKTLTYESSLSKASNKIIKLTLDSARDDQSPHADNSPRDDNSSEDKSSNSAVSSEESDYDESVLQYGENLRNLSNCIEIIESKKNIPFFIERQEFENIKKEFERIRSTAISNTVEGSKVEVKDSNVETDFSALKERCQSILKSIERAEELNTVLDQIKNGSKKKEINDNFPKIKRYKGEQKIIINKIKAIADKINTIEKKKAVTAIPEEQFKNIKNSYYEIIKPEQQLQEDESEKNAKEKESSLDSSDIDIDQLLLMCNQILTLIRIKEMISKIEKNLEGLSNKTKISSSEEKNRDDFLKIKKDFENIQKELQNQISEKNTNDEDNLEKKMKELEAKFNKTSRSLSLRNSSKRFINKSKNYQSDIFSSPHGQKNKEEKKKKLGCVPFRRSSLS